MPNLNKVIEHFSNDIFKKAKEKFGVTLEFRRGAWLLPCGFMLDFSQEQGRRDHSGIKDIFPESLLEQDTNQYIPEDRYVRETFLRLGAIRLVPEGGGLEVHKKPTSQQMDTILKYLNWLRYPEFYIHLEGRGTDFKQMYENTVEERSKAMRTIEDYYTGKLKNLSELQQFRYADEQRRDIKKY